MSKIFHPINFGGVMKDLLKRFLNEEDGQTATEYRDRSDRNIR